jgi:hypothetical protein
MDQQALQELIALFLKINPEPSDQQFHALAEACGVDKETLESVSYGMLADDEDLLEDAEYATAPSTSTGNGDSIGRLDADIYATAPNTSLEYGEGDGEEGESTHGDFVPDIPVAIGAATRLLAATAEEVLDNPMADPDDMTLQDVAMNDGDPTDDDLGDQEETLDDGFTEDDTGVGLVNNVSDVLTDDGVPDLSL